MIKRKFPVTVTETVWPSAGAAGHGIVEHVIVTFAGVISTKPPLASLVARHMTRFDSRFAEVQAVFGMNEVGLRDASRAASRAASLTLICE